MAKMPTFQVQVPIGNLPVNLILVGNKFEAGIVFVKVAPIHKTIIDHAKLKEVSAGFTDHTIYLHDDEVEEQFDYDTIYNYKEIPLMLRWLQQQNLQEPTVRWA